ncbi:MAG: AMP-binding protein, partial [Cyclobacteriaceae bacterium]|nr:AMP-binding protein [Cyclobacteriaceae bacterium]
MSTAHHTDFTRVFDVLEYQRLKFPQKRALNYFTNNEWVGFSTEEIQQRADSLSRWLLQRGYEKGDTAAFIPTMGSPLWLMVDFAFQQVGIIIVPIHPTASPEET